MVRLRLRRPALTSPWAAGIEREADLHGARIAAERDADRLEDALERVRAVTDETARHLGHAHPAVTKVRTILDEVLP